MKKVIFLLMLGWAGMMASCTMERSDNGDLDGMWQLTSLDSLNGGASADMRERGIYWSVQARLLEMRSAYDEAVNVFFRFEHRNDQLLLSQPVENNRDVGDNLLTDPARLRFYGLTSLSDTLRVLQLSGSSMVLQNREVRLHFRKY